MSQKKFFTSYKYDIALEQGANPYLVSWVSGLMVFFVALALFAGVALSSMTKDWTQQLSGSLTVELSPVLSTDGTVSDAGKSQMQARLSAIQELDEKHPAVAAVRVLKRDEVAALLALWLGRDVPARMPLPVLIDVKLEEGANVERLKKDIVDLVPQATIDDHSAAAKDMLTLLRTARSFMFLLTAAIVVLAVMTIAGIVRAKFAVHAQEVETLHLLGTSDEYIARQFRRYTLHGVLAGALVGIVCMGVVIAVIGAATGTVDNNLLPDIELSWRQWIALIFTPVLAGGAIAHITAQFAVMQELKKFP